MPQIEYVFLDNGGVLTDNSARAPIYRQLVGRYFAPRYGGTETQWEDANRDTFPRAWSRFLDRVANWREDSNVSHAVRLYLADWTRFLLTAAGVAPPDDDDECAAIGEEAERWINPQVVTLFPGVEETVRALGLRYRLFTASDGFSAPLAETLAPIATCFERLYGPDLVNVPKSAGRRYYEAIFSHARVDATRALVIDDNLANVLAAQEAGAHTVFVSAEPHPDYTGRRIARLSDLQEGFLGI